MLADVPLKSLAMFLRRQWGEHDRYTRRERSSTNGTSGDSLYAEGPKGGGRRTIEGWWWWKWEEEKLLPHLYP